MSKDKDPHIHKSMFFLQRWEKNVLLFAISILHIIWQYDTLTYAVRYLAF